MWHEYMLSCVGLSATPWTPLSMEFCRQEYWSGLPFPSPTVAYSWANHPTKSLFYNRVSNISHNLLNPILKVKNNGCMGIE